jgi:hypothetical protein
MSLKVVSAFLFSDYQRINTLARTVTYKYVDVNGNFSTLLFLTGGNNFYAIVINAKKFVSRVLRQISK